MDALHVMEFDILTLAPANFGELLVEHLVEIIKRPVLLDT